MADELDVPAIEPPGSKPVGGLGARFETMEKESLPTPKTRQEYESVAFGSKYISPEGETLTRYYRPKTMREYADVPEGAEYITPEGEKLTKKKTEGISFTSQMLFDMSVNDKERRKSLEYGYPGKVRENPVTGQIEVVEEDGTIRRPKGLTESPKAAAAALTSMAAPVAGSVLGTVGAGLPGTVGGAIGGQFINDAVMALFGTIDRSISEEAAAVGLSGASSIAGYGVGKGALAALPAVKTGITKGAPAALASVLGATKPGVEQALSLREKGVLTPISPWAPEAPYLINIGEVFDPAFRTQRPLEQSAIKHFENTSQQILKDAGIKEPTSVTKPTAAAPIRQAGEALKQKAVEQLAALDRKLDEQLAARQGAVRDNAGRSLAIDPKALQRTATEARQAAERVIKLGFDDIQQSVDQAMAAVKAGHNSGDLWGLVGDKLKAFREGIAAQARKMYNQADKAAGTHLPDVTDLPDLARNFLEQLPEGFENRYPSIVKQLRDIGGVEELDQAGNPTGNWVKEPANPTFGQLHNLRSSMRANYYRFDLTPDVKDGTFKYFANKVDDILKDPGAVPELKDAARLLRDADTFYRENMGPLTDKRIQAVMDGLSSGMPADPKVLFDAVVKEGRSDLTRKVQAIVGPNLWAGVKAADVQEMLDMSKTLVPDVLDGKKFAGQVLDRHRHNMLEAVHGREVSDKLLQQAQNIEALEGRLELPARPGDTMKDIIDRAHLAEEAAKSAAKSDPLAVLNKEMKAIEVDIARKRREVKNAAERDILGFVYDPTVGAAESAKRIIEREDLTIAAAARFGKDTPEFKMLQQAVLERILRQSRQPSTALSHMSEEVQNILFPGTTKEQLHMLAKEMDFLFGSKAHGMQSGKSIAAQQRVNHPWGSIPILRTATKAIGLDFVGRQILGKYYKTVLEIMNKPGLMRFVQKGLEGDELSRVKIRDMIRSLGNTGKVVGAGTGEAIEQKPSAPAKITRFDAQGNPVQSRAEGGPVQAGQPYLVGEQGPEVIYPAQSGAVDPRPFAGGRPDLLYDQTLPALRTMAPDWSQRQYTPPEMDPNAVPGKVGPGEINPLPEAMVDLAGSIPAMGAKAGIGALMKGAFFGPMARGADKQALNLAKLMEEKGFDRGQIRDATGWFQGWDKGWRFEGKGAGKISEGAPTEARKSLETDPATGRLVTTDVDKVQIPSYTKSPYQLADILDHPDVYENYPQLATRPVRGVGFAGLSGVLGGHNPETGELFLGSMPLKEASSTLEHEIMHAIQKIEGFTSGGSTKEFIDEEVPKLQKALTTHRNRIKTAVEAATADKHDFGRITESVKNPVNLPDTYKKLLDDFQTANPELFKEIEQLVEAEKGIDTIEKRAFKKYQSIAGEVEARNVQKRAKMTEEERKRIPPWETEDVPREKQLASAH